MQTLCCAPPPTPPMDQRKDLATILPFLPVILRSSSLFWPPKTLASMRALSLGPDISRVDAGEVFFDAILDLRETLGLSSTRLASKAADGFVLFFDELMDRVNARAWFGETVPMLARLLMKLPGLLEEHYKGADGVLDGRSAGLRILVAQEAGIVVVSQELAAALLVCSLFCLFPTSGRGANDLPTINFDHMFAWLLPDGKQNQEEKIKCLVHYFERISSLTPSGSVSFERKVLPLEHVPSSILYPEAVYWEKSVFPLCPFEVSHVGLIEDQKYEALEVDFANEYLGGGALHRGCVQEEIRFMINPELIVGMLFLPSMCANEAIEIVGAERFANYAGYASSFRFMGDYDDKKPVDSLGRRQTRIVAIDALCSPGIMQYGVKCLLRETNKAFCGFLNQGEYQDYMKTFQEGAPTKNNLAQVRDDICMKSKCFPFSAPADNNKMGLIDNSSCGSHQFSNCKCSQRNLGVATGNWGCGAFGGDPELKCIFQWLAASQALKTFILYYTFGDEALQRLKQVTEWILLHEWTVGDLWSMLVEYSSLRLNGQTRLGFLNWLLPLPENKATTEADDMSE